MRMPGSRKSSGEMLLVAFMPLHPAPNINKTVAAIANRRVFQLNLTKYGL